MRPKSGQVGLLGAPQNFPAGDPILYGPHPNARVELQGPPFGGTKGDRDRMQPMAIRYKKKKTTGPDLTILSFPVLPGADR